MYEIPHSNTFQMQLISRITVFGAFAFCLAGHVAGQDSQRIEITGVRVGDSIGALTLGTGFLGGGGVGLTNFKWDPWTRNATSEAMKRDPAAENNSKIDCDVDTTPHPVVVSTGEKFLGEQDFQPTSLYALRLTRTYRSASSGTQVFGPKWFGSLVYRRVQFLPPMITWKNTTVPSAVIFTEPNGTVYRYVAGPIDSESPVVNYTVSLGTKTGKFVRSYTTGWKLFRSNATYTIAGNAITRIADGSGVTQLTYTYDGVTGLPTVVTNTVGQSVAFAYANNRIVRATDTGGNVWTYDYNANGMLSSVTSPSAPADVRNYFYEDPSDATLLTGMAINGQRYSTYAYDSQKRAIRSGLTNGERGETFSYGTNQTIVTSFAGDPVTHTFQSLGSALLPTGQSRAATSTCAAAGALTTYDTNGYPLRRVDWNGVPTDYAYSASGQLLSVTTAAGTTGAATRVYSWINADDVRDVTYKDANGSAYAQATYAYFSTADLSNKRLSSFSHADLRTGQPIRVINYGYSFHTNQALASKTESRLLPNGSATTTTNYDALGNVISTVNGLGQQRTWSGYNGLGLPGRYLDLNGVATDFHYDAKGNLLTATQVLPTGSRVTNFAYNNNRQTTDITSPDGSIARYRYNAAMRLDRIGNAQSQFLTLPIDVAANRSSARSDRQVPSMSGSTPVANAAGEFVATTQRDSLGRPLQVIGNNSQRVTYEYDNNSNLTTRTDVAGRITRYEYDAQDRLKRTIAPDLGNTVYAYDSEGNLASVTDARGIPTTYTYNGLGQVTQRISRDTGTTTYGYDSAGRLATEQRANGIVVSYAWDALDRMTSRTAAGVTETFTYDEGTYGKGRLTRLNEEVAAQI